MTKDFDQQVTFVIVSDATGTRKFWDDLRFVDDMKQAKIYIATDCALTDWSRLKKFEAKIMQINVIKRIVRTHD